MWRLRVDAKLTQEGVATGIPTLDRAAVCEWEKGKHLRRFLIHVPQLLDRLGPAVLDLVAPVMAALGDTDEEVAVNIADLLAENGEVPSLDALATRLGHDLPLSIEDGASLMQRIVRSGIRYGWTASRLPEKQAAGR